jgi:hypothetical protein
MRRKSTSQNSAPQHNLCRAKKTRWPGQGVTAVSFPADLPPNHQYFSHYTPLPFFSFIPFLFFGQTHLFSIQLDADHVGPAFLPFPESNRKHT